MTPIRKSDGYTLDGIKKYKRFFQIERKTVIESNEETKQEHVEEKLSEDVLV